MLKSTYIFFLSVFFLTSVAQAQTSFSGYVKDAFGKAIESATITVVGTNLSTSTI